MKIRKKIALWISATGFLASLVFSIVVFSELIEIPYELIDRDFDNEISDLLGLLDDAHDTGELIQKIAAAPLSRRYGLRLYGQDAKLLWQSDMARQIDISWPDSSKPVTVTSKLPADQFLTDTDEDDQLAFRVKSISLTSGQSELHLLAAKPIEDMGAEIWELAGTMVIGLTSAVIVLFASSYWVAGRILNPIDKISRLAASITDKTLGRRIPLGRAQDELFRLSATMNAMFDRLELSFTKQKRFIADASHELKSPIALLRLQTDEFLQRNDLDQELRQDLARQAEALHRISRLVNNLLDLSILELRESLDLTSVNLSALCESVLNDYIEFIQAEGLTVKLNIPAEIQLMADAEKLRRVMVNLVDNGIKYNKKGGRLEINAHKEKKETLNEAIQSMPFFNHRNAKKIKALSVKGWRVS